MSGEPKVALIEIGTSHDECLHAQIAFLKHYGCRVHLILSDKVQQRAGAIGGVDHCFVVPEPRGVWSRLQAARRINRYLTAQDLRTVVFNTAHGKALRNLCLLADRRIRFAGILHGAGKVIRPSFTQWSISRRVQTYFVLNDYIRDGVRQTRPTLALRSLYPVFLPGCEQQSVGGIDTSADTDDHFTVCIPGPVHQGRRDYSGLLRALTEHPLGPSVRFVLLGKCHQEDWPAITRRIDAMGLRDQFTLFDRFVEQEEFRRHLARCDAVMPLIHPSTPNFANYRTVQISGSFNLAFAYRKPLLMHRAFDDAEDFQRTACFYDETDLVDIVNHLASDRAALDRQRAILRTWEKLSFEYQAEQYVSALGMGAQLYQTSTSPVQAAA